MKIFLAILKVTEEKSRIQIRNSVVQRLRLRSRLKTDPEQCFPLS
jgi:hypothetical protein